MINLTYVEERIAEHEMALITIAENMEKFPNSPRDYKSAFDFQHGQLKVWRQIQRSMKKVA